MKFSETKLTGLYIAEPEPFKDERGLFFRTFCKNVFTEIEHYKEFVQINQSINICKGTFRGLHYQLPPFKDVKLVRCISGSVIDIIVDVRKESDTFLKSFLIELSEENKRMIYIPEGFAHGFITLEDNTQLIYHHTSFYQPKHEGSLNINDCALNIKLPIKPRIMSKVDKNIPFVDDTFEGI